MSGAAAGPSGSSQPRGLLSVLTGGPSSGAAPSSGPSGSPIKTFKQVLDQLKGFNEAHGKMADLNGIIGGLNDKVKKLGELKGRISAALAEIAKEVQSLTVGNLEDGRKKLSEMTGTMHSELTQLNNLLPFPEGATGASRGGFQYKKSKSRIKSKSKHSRRTRRTKSKSKHSRRTRRSR